YRANAANRPPILVHLTPKSNQSAPDAPPNHPQKSRKIRSAIFAWRPGRLYFTDWFRAFYRTLRGPRVRIDSWGYAAVGPDGAGLLNKLFPSFAADRKDFRSDPLPQKALPARCFAPSRRRSLP